MQTRRKTPKIIILSKRRKTPLTLMNQRPSKRRLTRRTRPTLRRLRSSRQCYQMTSSRKIMRNTD